MAEQLNREDEAITNLLRLAGERDAVPNDRQERVYRRVHEEWRASVKAPDQERVYGAVRKEWRGGRRRRALLWAVPLVAAALAFVSILTLQQPDASIVSPVATVARVTGAAPSGNLPGPGDAVPANASIRTGPGERISLILRGGESLRVDQASSILLASSSEIQLLQGRIYADSGDFIYRDGNLRIDTSFGSVRDIGTQFAVSLSPDLLEVAVREGRVDVASSGETIVAIDGERLRLARDRQYQVDTIEPADSYWDWATDLAPSFDIENKSLLDFLKWACRELGLELVFPDNELRLSVMRTNLHGSIDGFDVRAAVESVLATTDLHYRFEENRLIIER